MIDNPARIRRSRHPVALIALIMLIVAGLPVEYLLADVLWKPGRDVPQWLSVTDTDMARCTLAIQVIVTATIAFGGFTVVMAWRRRDDEPAWAPALFAGLATAWLVLTDVVVVRGVWLGQRCAPSPVVGFGGSADPICYATNLDYYAYESRLLPALVGPAAWALGGGALAAAGYLGTKRIIRCRRLDPGVVVVDGLATDEGVR